jgi:hypothetical protein
MSGKMFGEMTHAEKTAAMKRAAGKLSAELTASAPAISAIMDEAIYGEDDYRDMEEEAYLGSFCPACGTAGCTWDGKPDGFHTDDEGS